MFEVNIYISMSVGNKVHTVATDFKQIYLIFIVSPCMFLE